MVLNLVKTIFNSNLLFAHCALHVLLVGQNEDGHFFQVLVDDDLEELRLGNHLIFYIGAVDDEDDGIGAGVVGLPDASHPLLAAEIPGRELDVVMGDLLYVAANGRRSLNYLPQQPSSANKYILQSRVVLPAFANPTISMLNDRSLLNSFPQIDVKIEPMNINYISLSINTISYIYLQKSQMKSVLVGTAALQLAHSLTPSHQLDSPDNDHLVRVMGHGCEEDADCPSSDYCTNDKKCETKGVVRSVTGINCKLI